MQYQLSHGKYCCTVQICEGSEPSRSREKHDSTDENIKMLSSRRPVYTIGPTSDMPVKILSGIVEPWGIATASNGDAFVVSKKGKKVVVEQETTYISGVCIYKSYKGGS